MIPKLSDDIQQALDARGGAPLYVMDARNTTYVLIRADQYEKLKALFGEDEDFDPRELYSLIEQSFLKAGWDDPEMDAYNEYEAHHPKP
jgi:hypothetical protein